MNESTLPEIKNDIVWRKEGSKQNIVSISSCNGGPIWLLNPVASRIIELLNEGNTVKDIIEDISFNFEVNYEEIKVDVINFLLSLQKRGIIKL